MISLNPDTPIHAALNRWFFAAELVDIVSVVRDTAQRLEPDLVLLLSEETPWGTTLAIDPDLRDQVARRVVLELLLGTLDPELIRSPIGEGFRAKVLTVSATLGLPDTRLKIREAAASDLQRWFSGVKVFSDNEKSDAS